MTPTTDRATARIQSKYQAQLISTGYFAAQTAGALESLYQWQWMVARVLRRSGDAGPARRHYEMALATLEPVRELPLSAGSLMSWAAASVATMLSRMPSGISLPSLSSTASVVMR